jgi:3',5'-cyclic AMP phosphodiesterase CpdA
MAKGSTTLTETSAQILAGAGSAALDVPGRPVVLAHLSDLHIDGTDEARTRMERVASYLGGLASSVDAVLVSGDVSDTGAAEDYVVARALLAQSPAPVLFAVGNHDLRAPFAAVLLGRPGHDPSSPVNQVHDIGGVRLVILDSVAPGRSDGHLDEATLDWLDATLAAAPATPTLVALHHPPVALGLDVLDAIRLANASELEPILARHACVVGVLCGHAHAAASSSFAGRPVRVAPGVRSSAVLPWEPAEASGPQVLSADRPVALAFHSYVEGVLTTHVRAL